MAHNSSSPDMRTMGTKSRSRYALLRSELVGSLRIKSERQGEVFADDDVKVFEERKVFGRGFVKREGLAEGL